MEWYGILASMLLLCSLTTVQERLFFFIALLRRVIQMATWSLELKLKQFCETFHLESVRFSSIMWLHHCYWSSPLWRYNEGIISCLINCMKSAHSYEKQLNEFYWSLLLMVWWLSLFRFSKLRRLNKQFNIKLIITSKSPLFVQGLSKIIQLSAVFTKWMIDTN